MRITLLRLAFTIVTVLGFIRGTAAAILENSMVRDWAVSAYSNDATNRFSHCAMSAVYKNGVLLMFIIDRDHNWFMALANQQWKLTEGQTYNFSIDLDGAKGNNWIGIAAAPEVLRVPLADSTRLFEKFSAAQTLTISAANQTFRFDLTNSRIALAATASCANRYMAMENTPSNPFERRGAPPSATAAKKIDALYAEGEAVMTKMLGIMGSTDHTMLPTDVVKAKFENDHAVWVGKGTAGSVRILPKASSLESLGVDLVAVAAKECQGRFATAKTNAPGAVKITAVCQNTAGTVSAQFIALPRPAGGAYLFVIFTTAQSSEAATSVVKYGDLLMASAAK
jgi:hypothetical protein